MSDAQALSATGASSEFTQQGQLDWVVLSRTTLSYSFDVVARLANAGVELVTIGVGKFICSQFAFPPGGQLELSKSLTHLKGTSSFSRVIWFGFGIKHVVRTLCETEQGATCVAICAALAIPNTSFRAAQVLRELCLFKGAPPNFSPSIHQWANLVEVSSGALTASNFPKYYDSFSRLLVPIRHRPKGPASPKDIAKALMTLGNLSKNILISAIFVGGLDCAWLAAVAQSLLCLRIEIRDENGHVLYRSSIVGLETTIQATFIREGPPDRIAISNSLLRKAFFISSGEALLHERINLANGPFRGPTAWATIITDAFPNWDLFSKSAVSRHFGRLIELVGVSSRQYYSAASFELEPESFPWLFWDGNGCLYHPTYSDPSSLQYARRVFPELASYLAMVADFEHTGDIANAISECLQKISNACICDFCHARSASLPFKAPLAGDCLVRTALTIVRLLLILSPVTVSDSIPPSISALKQLYACTSRHAADLNVHSLPCHGIALILFLFSGRLPMETKKSRISAGSAGGVCVFYSILKEIDLPPDAAMSIEIIPGHIKNFDRIYHYITDIQTTSYTKDEEWNMDDVPQDIELVAEEVEEIRTLSASYRARSRSRPLLYLGPCSLVETLRTHLRVNDSRSQDCSKIFHFDSETSEWEFGAALPPVTSFESHKSSWTLCSYECFNIANATSSTPPEQRLEINVFRSQHLFLLYLELNRLNRKFGNLPVQQARHRLALTRLEFCTVCCVKFACKLWKNLYRLPNRGSTHVLWNQAKKIGWVADSGFEAAQEVNFTLAPLLLSKEQNHVTKKLFRSLRISR